jgi:hypothetical protein
VAIEAVAIEASRVDCSRTGYVVEALGAVVEALGAVARRTLPRNLIRLLPVQDRKDEGSEDLLTRSPVHAIGLE